MISLTKFESGKDGLKLELPCAKLFMEDFSQMKKESKDVWLLTVSDVDV